MPHQAHLPLQPPTPEWFDRPDHQTNEPGLSFSCTQCGSCCTGEGGFVRFTSAEADALALHVRLSTPDFIAQYTHDTPAGRSLKEVTSEFGQDCIFLDRTTLPGRAICSVYALRPAQCRTWPFWQSNIHQPWAWARAANLCPGINKGTRYTPTQIRILRDTVEM